MKSFIKISFLTLIAFCVFGSYGSQSLLKKHACSYKTFVLHKDSKQYAGGFSSKHDPVRKILMRRFHHGIDESAFTIPDYSRGKVYSCIDIALYHISTYQSSHRYFFSPYKALPAHQVILASLPLRAPPFC